VTISGEFHQTVIQLLDTIHRDEKEHIQAAGALIADKVDRGGKLYGFGTGHSHMIVEEGFGRAGGPQFFRGIWMTPLMLHEGLQRSTQLERVSGIADILYRDSGITADDVLLVISNSGRNAAPIEMAMAARGDGIPVIAITSLLHSLSVTSRHASGKKLLDLADIVLDNHGSPGDASTPVGLSAISAGPTSTITGAYLLNAVLLESLAILESRGRGVPVFISANA
jgi:uncharacterized phosphosugar-binding protein